jgi:hypothetical protein
MNMTPNNRIIAPAAILALKKALAAIYWKKKDLRDFIAMTILHKTILGAIDWDGNTKTESASQLVGMLSQDQKSYHTDLIELLYHVSNFSDFLHLEDADDPTRRTKEAKAAVDALRKHTKGFFGKSEEEEIAKRRQEKAKQKIAEAELFREGLAKLKGDFIELSKMTNHQKRGYALERFLSQLFNFFDLDPRSSFKIAGEQIDGLFTFDNIEYNLEAKWHNYPTRGTDIYTLAAKVSGKGKLTMGLFVSINGFSELYQGPNDLVKSIMLMDGQDIMYVVDGSIRLPELLYAKRRHLSAEGNIYLPARDII